jgi:predicted RNA-binding protein with PIN domain
MTVFYSTRMRLFVDGMNVIGSRPDGWWRDRQGAMRALIDELARYSIESGDAVTVVLDARPFEFETAEDAELEVAFAYPGRDAADDEIVRRLGELADRDDTAIVTSDDALARRARALGAGVIPAGSFRRRLDRA